MIQNLHVGRGTQRGPLTVFPIWHETVEVPAVSLAGPRTVDVRELESPEVPFLQVAATGKSTVLLLEGDVLVGGLQNRVVAESRLLSPGTTEIVDVRCVEQERWHGSDRQVAGTLRASAFVRADTDQREVWRRVAIERSRDVRPPDVAGLRPLPGQSGVLIGIGGVPILLEVFAEPGLLTRAWPRILDAVAREAAGHPPKATTAHSARRFIGLVDGLRPIPGSRTGIGTTVRGRHGPLELRGIRDESRLVHASVINKQGVTP